MALRFRAPTLHTDTIENLSNGDAFAHDFEPPLQIADFSGGAGDDHCIDSTPGSNLDGGAGTDTLTLTRNFSVASISFTFTPGGTFVVSDGTHVTNFEFIELSTGSGADSVTFNNPLTSANPLSIFNQWDAGAGVDRANLNYSALATALQVSNTGIGSYSVSNQGNTVFILSNVEDLTVSGGSGDDVVGTTTGNDILNGNNGNDDLQAGDGNDTINGGAGNDYADGGTGLNTLAGAAGNDVLADSGVGGSIDGGGNADVLILDRSAASSAFTFSFASGNATNTTLVDGTTFKNVEVAGITTGSGDDSVSFSAITTVGSTGHFNGFNFFNGGAGNDRASLDYSNYSTTVQLSNVGIGSYSVTNASLTSFSLSSIENVTFTGGSGDDIAGTTDGNDVLNGNAGNDDLQAGAGNDTINAGDGDDYADGGTGLNTLSGGNGLDVLADSGAGGSIDGGAGADVLVLDRSAASAAFTFSFVGGNSSNTTLVDATTFKNVEVAGITTGSGDDSVSFSSITAVASSSHFNGFNVFNGGAGNDRALLDYSNYSTTVQLSNVGIGSYSVTNAALTSFVLSSTENVTFTGGSGDDIAFTTDGSDVLNGNAGNDDLQAGAGNDTINAGDGDDYADGGTGLNALSGGNGLDVLVDSGAGGSIDGGASNDVLILDRSAASAAFVFSFAGGSGTNTNLVDGTAFKNVEVAGITTGSGDDSVSFSLITTVASSAHFNGFNVFNGGAGNDRASLDYSNYATTVQLSNVGIGSYSVTNAALTSFALSSTENVTFTGGSGDDIAGTTDGNDVLRGNAGNDDLQAGDGNDTIDGGAGNDYADGGTGLNTLIGGGGLDVLVDSGAGGSIDGGGGADVLILDRSASSAAQVFSFVGGNASNTTLVDGTTFKNVEVAGITTGSGDDSVSFSFITTVASSAHFNGFNVFNGGAGNDRATLDYSNYGTAIQFTNTGIGSYSVSNVGLTSFALSNIEDVSVSGGAGADVIGSVGGNDVLNGNGGNDDLQAGAGNDTINGGDGNDYGDGGTGLNALTGGNGNDVLADSGVGGSLDGGANADAMILDRSAAVAALAFSFAGGNAGNTTLVDGTTFKNMEVASITTGSGDDSVSFSNITTVASSAHFNGFNVFNGGNGNDRATLDYSNYATAVQLSNVGIGAYSASNASLTSFSLSSIENVTFKGGAGDDTVTTSDGTDIISGGAGNDTLDGGAGTDTADFSSDTGGVTVNLVAGTATGAQSGNDTVANFENVTGGGGNDTISGTDGANVLLGGNGNDTLIGGLGDDTLNGGAGSDTADYSADTQGVNANLFVGAASGAGIGNDLLIGIENVTSGSGNDTLIGDANANTLIAGSGNDSLAGGGGNDTLKGGAGIDTADFSVDTAGVTVDLVAGTATGSLNGSDTLSGIENIISGSGNDTLTGDTNVNVITGGAGNDTIHGGDNDDSLFSGVGTDKLFGDNGNDVLVFGASFAATDQVDGGTGNDTLVLNGDYSAGVVLAATTLVNVELIQLAAGFDYSLTTNNANVAAGATLILDGSTLGGGDDVVFNGAAEANGAFILKGGAGIDTLTGGTGADTLSGGAGNDALNGGAGVDTADYSADSAGVVANIALGTATGSATGNDTLAAIENLTGGSGNDTLTGDGAVNSLIGGAGNDALDGGAGNDSLLGGAGNDTLAGGTGNDSLDGGADTDTADYSSDAAGVTVNLQAGTATGSTSGNDTLANIENATGGSGNDTLTGDGNSNLLMGGAGNDTLNGGAGDDLLDGGAGNDTADYSGDAGGVTANLGAGTASGGASGNDTLVNIENLTGGAGGDTLTGDGNVNVLNGGAGNDVLDGGAGDDRLIGGAGDDSLTGGSGFDTADYSADGSGVTVNLGAGTASGATSGNDTLSGIENVIGGGGGDTLTGDNNANQLQGGAGNDRLIGNGGNDILDGGLGKDTADYSTDSAGFAANLASGIAIGTGSGIDTLIGIESLTGGNGNDWLVGDLNANTLAGGNGNDLLMADAGDDTLQGGSGDDTLQGGAGNDALNGNNGNDTADYSNDTAGVVANLTAGTATGAAAGSDTLLSIENLVGGIGNDTLTGDRGNNTLNGGAGDDAISGSTGNDTIDGGAGNDTLDGGKGTDTADFGSDTGGVTASLVAGTATGSLSGTDTLTGFENLNGGSGNDTLTGDANSNVLSGDVGNDTLTGGGGSDTLIVGDGNDVLVYSAVSDSTGSGCDVAVGFDFAVDKIDLTTAVTAIDGGVSGTLSVATFDADLATRVTAAKLGASHALLFTANAGDLSGQVYLVIDSNGTAGYQSGQDLVIQLDSALHTGSLAIGTFI